MSCRKLPLCGIFKHDISFRAKVFFLLYFSQVQSVFNHSMTLTGFRIRKHYPAMGLWGYAVDHYTECDSPTVFINDCVSLERYFSVAIGYTVPDNQESLLFVNPENVQFLANT